MDRLWRCVWCLTSLCKLKLKAKVEVIHDVATQCASSCFMAMSVLNCSPKISQIIPPNPTRAPAPDLASAEHLSHRWPGVGHGTTSELTHCVRSPWAGTVEGYGIECTQIVCSMPKHPLVVERCQGIPGGLLSHLSLHERRLRPTHFVPKWMTVRQWAMCSLGTSKRPRAWRGGPKSSTHEKLAPQFFVVQVEALLSRCASW